MLPDECGYCGMEPVDPTDPNDECELCEHQAMEQGDAAACAAHDAELCEECLAAKPVACQCRCGECCEHLILEATMRDGVREPRIRELAKPIFDDMSGVRVQIGWLLNGPTRSCVFFQRDGDGNGVCTIHDTRPTMCRLYDCDHKPAEHGE